MGGVRRRLVFTGRYLPPPRRCLFGRGWRVRLLIAISSISRVIGSANITPHILGADFLDVPQCDESRLICGRFRRWRRGQRRQRRQPTPRRVAAASASKPRLRRGDELADASLLSLGCYIMADTMLSARHRYVVRKIVVDVIGLCSMPSYAALITLVAMLARSHGLLPLDDGKMACCR